MAAAAPFSLILVAQSMGACSELFGQRLSRRCHKGSSLRMLISMSVWCFMQAFVVLGIAELALPTAWTGGQGSLSMWGLLYTHPWMWGNAFNNSIYWLSMAVLLREPLGSLLVVLSFLSGSFMVDPLSSAVGLAGGAPVTLSVLLLSILGSALCAVDIPLSVSEEITSVVLRRRPQQRPHASPIDDSEPPPPSTSTPTTVEEGASLLPAHFALTAPTLSANDARPVESAPSPGGHSVGVAVAFCVLAVTTGVGVVFAAYAETHAGLTSFGYTAVDQMLLPFTTLPLVALLGAFAATRSMIGEPDDDVGSEGSGALLTFAQQLARAWAEVNATPHGGGSSSGSGGGDGRGSDARETGCAAVAAAAASTSAECHVLFTRNNERGSGAGVMMPVNEDADCPASGEGDGDPTQFTARQAPDAPPGADGGADRSAPPSAAPHPTRLLLLRGGAGTGSVNRHTHALEGDGGDGGANDGTRSPRRGMNVNSAGLSTSTGNSEPPARPTPRCCAPSTFWWTLIPFHGIEFCRSLLFFYLVTSFDVGATYVTMTLVRIVMVWVVAVAACTVFSAWVGVSAEETRATLHPVSVAVKVAGSAVLVAAMAAAHGVV